MNAKHAMPGIQHQTTACPYNLHAQTQLVLLHCHARFQCEHVQYRHTQLVLVFTQLVLFLPCKLKWNPPLKEVVIALWSMKCPLKMCILFFDLVVVRMPSPGRYECTTDEMISWSIFPFFIFLLIRTDALSKNSPLTLDSFAISYGLWNNVSPFSSRW